MFDFDSLDAKQRQIILNDIENIHFWVVQEAKIEKSMSFWSSIDFFGLQETKDARHRLCVHLSEFLKCKARFNSSTEIALSDKNDKNTFIFSISMLKRWAA